jgi:uncharacterized protein YidB (DUF937 family)
MGLLDDLLGQLGGGAGGPRPRRQPQPTSLGGNADMGRILMALLPVVLAMLARRGRASGGSSSDLAPGAGGGTGGGLGDILGDVLGGGGRGGKGGGGLGDVLGDVLGGGGGRGGAERGGGGGGGLGDILGDVLGGGAGGSGMGGLGGLLEGFQRAGLGKQAQSWVSTGPNETIPPEAVERVFGAGGLDEIARRAGLSHEETAQGLAALLPEIVDEVTPEGRVPDTNSLLESVQALGRRMNPPAGG